MTFIYPAVLTANEDTTYTVEFPDLEGIYINEKTMDRAFDEAREAMYNWLLVEFEEEDPQLPAISDPEDITLEANQSIHNIMVHFRFHTGWDE